MRGDIVQIQTIDACNAKCHKCPFPDTYHTKRVMDDAVFLKIVEDIGRIDNLHRVCLYLENEPLLDSLLFKRARLLKRVFGSKIDIEISTNCLLLPKYREEIYQNFDRIILSLQGWDSYTYNLIHRLNIKENHYEKMREAGEDLRDRGKRDGKHVDLKIWDPDQNNNGHIEDINDVDEWYRMSYSRGGFLNKERVFIKKLDGCLGSKHEFFNFLFDGTMILCCMDYRRQTVLGNIKHQSLQDIVNSELAQNMWAKVEGNIDSDDDFICKKCELGKGENNDIQCGKAG